MTVINGLPAHALLVHCLVVFVPLTALLEIVCAVWAAARRGHLLWLTLILAAATTVLTPITTNAGEWLYDLRRNPDPILREHAELGDTLIYFSAASLVVALALVALRIVERRGDKRQLLINVVAGVVAVVVGVASMIQVYRIGDAGAQSVWGNEIAHLKKASGS